MLYTWYLYSIYTKSAYKTAQMCFDSGETVCFSTHEWFGCFWLSMPFVHFMRALLSHLPVCIYNSVSGSLVVGILVNFIIKYMLSMLYFPLTVENIRADNSSQTCTAKHTHTQSNKKRTPNVISHHIFTMLTIKASSNQ